MANDYHFSQKPSRQNTTRRDALNGSMLLGSERGLGILGAARKRTNNSMARRLLQQLEDQQLSTTNESQPTDPPSVQDGAQRAHLDKGEAANSNYGGLVSVPTLQEQEWQRQEWLAKRDARFRRHLQEGGQISRTNSYDHVACLSEMQWASYLTLNTQHAAGTSMAHNLAVLCDGLAMGGDMAMRGRLYTNSFYSMQPSVGEQQGRDDDKRNTGTQIDKLTVENLYFNTLQDRRDSSNPSTAQRAIMDPVGEAGGTFLSGISKDMNECSNQIGSLEWSHEQEQLQHYWMMPVDNLRLLNSGRRFVPITKVNNRSSRMGAKNAVRIVRKEHGFCSGWDADEPCDCCNP
ncbi:hypothetical protein K431DRAFT_300757 [Polychaeton citri CBS 116435]|uniref:Uncharacterized protein n=1 Tax=Polychaeton citri CBS 116435 TaxID=1314669 RepID=A0A9P4QGG6_9PEZI|nr:hypothetical protein K431DRAFT_300757 [Polychaeton citri CBS 116435]